LQISLSEHTKVSTNTPVTKVVCGGYQCRLTSLDPHISYT